MRYSTSYIPVVVHGTGQSLDRFPVSPSPCSRAVTGERFARTPGSDGLLAEQALVDRQGLLHHGA